MAIECDVSEPETAEGFVRRVEDEWGRVDALINCAGPYHPNVSESPKDLAALYDALGVYDMAEPLYKRALDIDEEILDPDDLKVERDINNLAELYEKWAGTLK